MSRLSLILIALLIIHSVCAQPKHVQTGIEVLRERHFDILQGKMVGLITNPTGVDSKLNSTIDILSGAGGVKLVALFAPEHGVRGDHAAGETVESYIDEPTKLPVYSLYGKVRKPTQKMLDNVDVLVYDIQDIGCRAYTYISTMGLAMEAAAENHIEFVVLDRPDPLGGERVEGNIVETGFTSFLSQFPIPYVYGLTCGELARLLNEEGLLKDGVRCKLTVVPMKGWRRSMVFDDTGLPWVPTSPHLPTAATAAFCVATGILGELGVVSEGVGYTLPFQTLAAPWINPALLAEALNGLKIDAVRFRPLSFKPFYGRWKDSTLHGVQLYFTDASKLNLMSMQFLFMQVHHELYPGVDVFSMAGATAIKSFDNVLGTSEIRMRFSKRLRYEDIKEYLEKDVADFRKRSEKYWIY